MGQFEIIEFYLELVRRAQERGICCAITSGMACVAYEVAEATKDCDLLCEPDHAADFLALLAASPVEGAPCQYRGNISPPLDARWHRGGWTSHFEWPGTEAFLDVFGIAPRARSAWQEEMLPPLRPPPCGGGHETHRPGKGLAVRPLGATEFAEMIAAARKSTLALIHPSLEEYLPDINANYRILIPGLA